MYILILSSGFYCKALLCFVIEPYHGAIATPHFAKHINQSYLLQSHLGPR